MNQLDKHCITTYKSSNLRVGKHVSKTKFSSSTEQHLDSRASWIVALGTALPHYLELKNNCLTLFTTQLINYSLI